MKPWGGPNVMCSLCSSKGDDEDENEVFLRPASQREKCLKDGVGSGLSQTEEPFEEISREAELLARQLATGLQDPKALEVSSANTNSQTEVMETFQTNLTAKQDLFSKPADVVLSPIKRETFCVQDSPMKQLPPAIQQRLMKAAGSVKSRISTSSPLRQTNAQPKVPLRGKAMLAKTRSTLPSKPTLPAPTKTAPAKAKTGLSDRSRFQLTVHKNPIRASSAEDLLSDSASVASDVSDSHLNTSLPVKRALQTGPRGPSSTKVPAVSGRRVVDRGRNTSSSSSSVSSINSSLSVSPTGKGKLNASLNSSGASMRAPSSVTKLPSSATSGQKQKQSLASRVPGATVGGRRSISAQGRRVSEAFLASTKSTPSKNPAPKPNPISACATPVRRTMERTISVPNMPANRSDSVAKGNPRLRALVIPTPLKHFKGTQPAEGTSPEAPRIMKPKRLAISCSLESLAPPDPLCWRD
uniref:G2 and S phase-expressed protein 1 N-terminal domain-containing protein n=1 Tax=Denticeps clupeoides TaxID=299321 RepID=A0AAY4BVY1_9TELE